MSKTRTLMAIGTMCAVLLGAMATETPAGEKGLIGYWKFDEGKGSVAADFSDMGNNGRINGAVAWAKGRDGSALKFDGTSTYVDIPKSPSLDNLKQITLMAWINTPLNARHSIFERWLYGGTLNERALQMDVSSTGKIATIMLSSDGARGGALTSTTTIPADKWVHLAATSDGRKVRIYINGQEEFTTGDAPEKIHPSAANLHIGAWYAEGKWDGYFEGLIDEAKIYSRALTPMEILNQYKKDAAKGGIEGRVRDINKKPIAGATVRVGLFSTTTDAEGNFSMPDVPVATYRVTAIKKGFVQKTKRNVEIEEDDDTVVSFKLKTDTTAPVISDVKIINKASLSAIITWATDEPAGSTVKFGVASGKYDRTAGNAEYTNEHSVALTGLKPETTYYFVAESIDKAENSTQSRELSFTTDKLGGVIIWDTNKKYLMKGPTPHAMRDRDKWTQVPYGVTDYKFIGDPMIQNECGQLFLFTNKEDSVDFAARLETGGVAGNEIYKVYDRSIRHFGGGTVYTKILRNTPDEMTVEHAGLSMRRGANNVITNYTLRAGKPWLEIVPVDFVNQQGMHGKTRICAYVNKDGTEFIFDSKRIDYKKDDIIYAPEGTIGIINFHRGYASKYDFMWFLMLSPGAEKNPRTYLGLHSDPFWGEEVSPDRPSVGAQYVYMDKDKPAAITALRYRNCWTRENVEKQIQAGETYTTKFAPPYPGKWRLIGRVENPDPAEKATGARGEKIVYGTVRKFYGSTVDVTAADVAAKKKFTFTSKVGGKLDYVMMYLCDRNDDTPKDICTPMDAYKGAILHE
ncbi:MAG: LamG-like jellyroll fold domain-containing protein [Planctomycetota bacterium]|nr:LamG-like jellyroll fold domain-containing protein [Planctomycetota bacterium]